MSALQQSTVAPKTRVSLHYNLQAGGALSQGLPGGGTGTVHAPSSSQAACAGGLFLVRLFSGWGH